MLSFRLFALFLLFTFSCLAYTQEVLKDSVYFNRASDIFDKVREICDEDNGKLLGFHYYCPLLLIDRESRFVVSNIPLSFSDNKPVKGIYYGKLPEKYLIANTAISIDSILYACVSVTNDIPKEIESLKFVYMKCVIIG